jgi:hypothetical protein
VPTSTQLRATWHSDSLDMVGLPSTGASRYHNCCTDGGTSPEYFGCNLVFLLHRADFPGKEVEGLTDTLRSLLENGAHSGSYNIRDQGEWSGRIRACSKSSSRHACFTVVESFDECCGPGEGMGTLSSGARNICIYSPYPKIQGI